MVVGMRLSNNESIIKPRSHCDKCKKVLSWYELIPVISYIIMGGKCSKCNNKVSIFYPLVELLSGTLFGLSYFAFGLSYNLLISLVISSMVVIIFVSDFKYLIILDQPLIISIVLIIIIKYFSIGIVPTCKYVVSGLVLFLFMFTIKLLGDYFYKRESLGGGDIKLSLLIGLTLGIRLGFVAIVLASLLALPYALVITRKDKYREVPYGPFLILATFIVYLFMNQINLFLYLYFNIL